MILQNFVVLEGADGSGTTTQLELLRKKLSTSFLVTTFEPTEGPIGKLLRESLRGRIPLEQKTLAYLFAADRQEHLYAPEGIVSQCQMQKLVISDRYVPSSLVYQGLLCGDDFVAQLNRDFPYPELLLYFRLPPEIAAGRYEKRTERDIYEQLEFQKKIHQRYEALLPSYCEKGGSRFIVIDATKSIDAVAKEVWRALSCLPIVKRICETDLLPK
ncbi:MAG: dTMP kinase [Treponemataceae bacterium]|nr:dTMP kinase [Treponemataceae bacterium]